MIELNYTILIQMIIFIGLILISNQIFYKPIFQVLDRRKELIDGNLEKARELRVKAEEFFKQYEEKLLEARQKAVAIVNEARMAAQEAQKEALSKARAEMEEMLAGLKKELEKEKEAARETLRQTAKVLAILIAEKIAGRRFEEERV